MADYNQQALMMQMMAQQQAQGALQQGQDKSISALGDAYRTGRTDVTSAVPQQTGALQTGYQNAGQAIQGGLTGSLSALGQGYDAATGSLGTGYNTARSDVAGGVSAFDPFYQSGTAANTAFANAYGVNGADASNAAFEAYKSSPQYRLMVEEAKNRSMDVMRQMGAKGMLGSGNTIDAVGTNAASLADQRFGDYLTGLYNLGGRGMQAADARMRGGAAMGELANQYGMNTANLASDYGRTRANAYDAYGTRGADLATGLGTNLANVYGGSANTLANLAQGYGTNQANVYTNTAGNMANTLMQGAQLSSQTLGQQAQQQYAQRQMPWAIAGGALSGLANIGSGLAGNPRLFS